MNLTKKYVVYLIRWQLSTPIIAVVLSLLAHMNTWTATIIANFLGGLVFFWIDRFIFTDKKELIKKDNKIITNTYKVANN